MIKILLTVFLFISLSDAKTITVWGEDRALTKIDARKKALENAKAVASEQLNTKVATSYLEIQKEIDGKHSTTMTVSQNFQTSKATLKVVKILDKKIVEGPYTPNFGSIYEVKIKVKFEIIEDKKRKIISKPIKESRVKKQKNIKKKIVKKEFNCNIKIKYNGKNKFYKKIKKSIVIIPIDKFYKIKRWKKQFSKTSRFYKNIAQYIYKFKADHINKNLKKGSYKTLILLGDEFLLSEKSDGKLHFQDLVIETKIIQKNYEILDGGF